MSRIYKITEGYVKQAFDPATRKWVSAEFHAEDGEPHWENAEGDEIDYDEIKALSGGPLRRAPEIELVQPL